MLTVGCNKRRFDNDGKRLFKIGSTLPDWSSTTVEIGMNEVIVGVVCKYNLYNQWQYSDF